MSGTIKGGKKAAIQNRRWYGRDFYTRIGRLGGQASRNGGFASLVIGSDGLTGLQRARMVGAWGGAKSRRGPAKGRYAKVR